MNMGNPGPERDLSMPKSHSVGPQLSSVFGMRWPACPSPGLTLCITQSVVGQALFGGLETQQRGGKKDWALVIPELAYLAVEGAGQ